MDWESLLSAYRVPHNEGVFVDPTHARRSVFLRDWDRILYSAPFRRMHDKTQVFPLPDGDVVHSRLTHSLEVASVGRSLGIAAGQIAVRRGHLLPAKMTERDVGDVVAAGCLAHDIGNPPFGHAGEDAIAAFFRTHPQVLEGLTERQQADLTTFEGNAQGFRILTRLQMEPDGGMRLTAPTLAAFSKYPRGSGDELGGLKKYGVFQSEMCVFEKVANATGLGTAAVGSRGGKAWNRHPLAFLVEAADDICYAILDLEDGLRLGYVDQKRGEELLTAIALKKELRDTSRLDAHGKAAYLRSRAISGLIDQTVRVFEANFDAILEGARTESLVKSIESTKEREEVLELTKRQCYRCRRVEEIELAGYRVLSGLLEDLIPAALAADPSQRDAKLLRLLPVPPTGTRYEKLLRVTDYVSGMSDGYALSLYRRLRGIAVAGVGGP